MTVNMSWCAKCEKIAYVQKMYFIFGNARQHLPASLFLQRNVYQVNIVLRMFVVLVDGGGAKAVHKFENRRHFCISAAVILHPAWALPFIYAY